MRTSESTAELVKALVAARRGFTPVRKDAKGQVGQNREYRYADLAGILDATMPALLEHGLIVLQAVDAETSSLITRLAHISGEWAESAYPLNLSQPPQQFGASLTYARRYSLQSLLCLAAEDDGAAAQVAPAKRMTGTQPIRPTTTTRPAPTADNNDGAAAQPKQRLVPAVAAAPTPEGRINEAQRRRLFEIATAAGWSTEAVKDHLWSKYGVRNSTDVRTSTFDRICADFTAGARPRATMQRVR